MTPRCSNLSSAWRLFDRQWLSHVKPPLNFALIAGCWLWSNLTVFPRLATVPWGRSVSGGGSLKDSSFHLIARLNDIFLLCFLKRRRRRRRGRENGSRAPRKHARPRRHGRRRQEVGGYTDRARQIYKALAAVLLRALLRGDKAIGGTCCVWWETRNPADSLVSSSDALLGIPAASVRLSVKQEVFADVWVTFWSSPGSP